jgi:hypothetical protein
VLSKKCTKIWNDGHTLCRQHAKLNSTVLNIEQLKILLAKLKQIEAAMPIVQKRIEY